MDEKAQDKSAESRKEHLTYYKSLSKIIENIEDEKRQETEPAILEHLDKRVQAIKEDQKRIRAMFPGIEE